MLKVDAAPETDRYHYFDSAMEHCTAPSRPETPPQSGEFRVNQYILNLFLQDNPWIYSYRYLYRMPEDQPSRPLFQYCVMCGEKNFEDEYFENLYCADKSSVHCNKSSCESAFLNLQQGRYTLDLAYNVIFANQEELKSHYKYAKCTWGSPVHLNLQK